MANGENEMNEPSQHRYSYEKKILQAEKRNAEKLLAVQRDKAFLVVSVVVLSVFCIASLVFNMIMFSEVIESEKRQSKIYQEVYNIRGIIDRNTKEYQAIQDIQKVILEYNYKYYSKRPERLQKMAETIYRIGFAQYGIPIEEWLILFSMESGWNRKAVSHAGARGIAQIMEETGRWVCRELNIPWGGVEMLFDEIISLRIGMFYYRFLKEKYEDNPMYYIAAYNLGETKVYRYWNATPPKPIRTSYLKKWVAEKRNIERILGRPITITGVNEDEFIKPFKKTNKED